MKENIPEQLYSTSQGLIMIPTVINAGFVVAAKRGKGISIVENADGTLNKSCVYNPYGWQLGVTAKMRNGLNLSYYLSKVGLF